MRRAPSLSALAARSASVGALLTGVAVACGSAPGSDASSGASDGGGTWMDGAESQEAAPSSTASPGEASDGAAVADGGPGEASVASGTDAGLPAEEVGASDARRPALPPFGNETIHPDRISFYMVPDLEGGYTGNWGAVQATLVTLHDRMPEAWIRWDNETGHSSNDETEVSKFVGQAATAGVPMIVTASACPNYNNMWANRYVTGNTMAQANASILDVANGGFLSFTASLATANANVRLVETLNEPDGPGWFVTDPDNTADFDTYMSKLYPALGVHAGDVASASKLVGPAVAFEGTGSIWNDWMGRSELTNVSYHTYGDPARAGLHEVAGKHVYVTEYGFNTSPLSPAVVLDDLWNIEKSGMFSGTIQKVFYDQLLQNGSNPAAFSQNIETGQSHFAERGWFRALSAWVALGAISTAVERDDAHPDFLASDDRNGHLGVLLWNASGSAETGQTRTITNTSADPGVALHVLHVLFGGNTDVATAGCADLSAQSVVSATVTSGGISVTVNSLGPQEALFVSTSPCDALAN